LICLLLCRANSLAAVALSMNWPADPLDSSAAAVVSPL